MKNKTDINIAWIMRIKFLKLTVSIFIYPKLFFLWKKDQPMKENVFMRVCGSQTSTRLLCGRLNIRTPHMKQYTTTTYFLKLVTYLLQLVTYLIKFDYILLKLKLNHILLKLNHICIVISLGIDHILFKLNHVLLKTQSHRVYN